MSLRLEEPRAPWHWWFAWHPVRLWNGDWTWCCWLHRTLTERHQEHHRRRLLTTRWVLVRPRRVFKGKPLP